LWALDELNAEDNTSVTESLASFGLVMEKAPQQDEVFLWPENLSTWNLWNRIQTQWRVGTSGFTGLDYSGVQVCMIMCGIKPKDSPEIFSALQAMEISALVAWAEIRTGVNSG